MDSVQISLTKNEAIILFEWLSRLDESVNDIDDVSKSILWKIEGQIESKLVDVLSPDYAERLAAAKAKLLKGN